MNVFMRTVANYLMIKALTGNINLLMGKNNTSVLILGAGRNFLTIQNLGDTLSYTLYIKFKLG